jgi:hypothetical protein
MRRAKGDEGKPWAKGVPINVADTEKRMAGSLRKNQASSFLLKKGPKK